MKHAGKVFFLLATAWLTGCPRQDASFPSQHGQVQGQWSTAPQGTAPTPGQWAPPPQGTAPPPAYTPPGQWIPPSPSASAPAPWWQPQPGAFPLPFPFPSQGQTPQLPPVPAPFAPDLGQRCVNIVNDYRASQRLPPLQRWWQTETCAGGQARDGAASGQPHGSFGRCAEQGQNVCPAWAGPADRMIAPCVQTMWNEGPGADFAQHGHYINLSSTRFTRVSCGFYTAPTGQVWLVQDFQ